MQLRPFRRKAGIGLTFSATTAPQLLAFKERYSNGELPKASERSSTQFNTRRQADSDREAGKSPNSTLLNWTNHARSRFLYSLNDQLIKCGSRPRTVRYA